MMRFHPDYSKKKASVSEVLGVATNLPAPPDAGRGGSDGPGTYRRITDGNYDVVERKGGGKGKGKPTQSTVVEVIAIEDMPPTPGTYTVVHAIEDRVPDESTVVEKGKAGKAVEKGNAGKASICGGGHTGKGKAAVAETPWPLFDGAAHRAAVDEHKLAWNGWRWTLSAYGSSTSSSTGWNQGSWSSSDWQSGWNQ